MGAGWKGQGALWGCNMDVDFTLQTSWYPADISIIICIIKMVYVRMVFVCVNYAWLCMRSMHVVEANMYFM